MLSRSDDEIAKRSICKCDGKLFDAAVAQERERVKGEKQQQVAIKREAKQKQKQAAPGKLVICILSDEEVAKAKAEEAAAEQEANDIWLKKPDATPSSSRMGELNKRFSAWLPDFLTQYLQKHCKPSEGGGEGEVNSGEGEKEAAEAGGEEGEETYRPPRWTETINEMGARVVLQRIWREVRTMHQLTFEIATQAMEAGMEEHVASTHQ